MMPYAPRVHDDHPDNDGLVHVMLLAQLPNVLVTGTPGTGKTTTAERVAGALAGGKYAFSGHAPAHCPAVFWAADVVCGRWGCPCERAYLHSWHGHMNAFIAGFTHVNVSEMVKDKSLHSGKHDDEELDTFVLDEDLVW